jgi:predicted nucleic acid-binding protein
MNVHGGQARMSAPDFLDTNILLYAYDPTDRRKQRIAQEMLSRGAADDLVISTQVLAEFASNLLHKMSPRAQPAAVLGAIALFRPLRLVASDTDTVRRAIEVHARYGLHFYDGMIVAAAERAGCHRIWSEDLKAGQAYFGVKVENPFA